MCRLNRQHTSLVSSQHHHHLPAYTSTLLLFQLHRLGRRLLQTATVSPHNPMNTVECSAYTHHDIYDKMLNDKSHSSQKEQVTRVIAWQFRSRVNVAACASEPDSGPWLCTSLRLRKAGIIQRRTKLAWEIGERALDCVGRWYGSSRLPVAMVSQAGDSVGGIFTVDGR